MELYNRRTGYTSNLSQYTTTQNHARIERIKSATSPLTASEKIISNKVSDNRFGAAISVGAGIGEDVIESKELIM
jgi:hypothetical protein